MKLAYMPTYCSNEYCPRRRECAKSVPPPRGARIRNIKFSISLDGDRAMFSCIGFEAAKWTS